MDRLQKNCVIASASLHGLLASAFLFGSAFLSPSSKTLNLDVLTVIPATLVDAPFSNPGGNPKVTQPPAVAPQARPEPPAPAPEPEREPAVKPQPPAPKDRTPPKLADEPEIAKPTTGKHRPVVNPERVTRKPDPRSQSKATDSAADARARAKAAADANRRARLALRGALDSISDVASSSTSVEIPGPGGEAYANYAQVVKSIYTAAWIVPTSAKDDATAIVKVVIAMDGTVISADIIRSSGDALVDSSVRRALDRVPSVAPFPAGSKDSKREFTLSFTPKNKRQLG